MKQNHMMALMQTGFTTIRVCFMDYAPAAPAPKQGRPPSFSAPEQPQPWEEPSPGYAYKALLEWDVKVQDYVVVNTPSGMKIALVTQVDETPNIDPDSNYEYKWIVQKVDFTKYNSLLAQEKLFLQALTQVERTKKVEEMKQEWLNALPEGSAARKEFDAALSLFSPVAPAPPAPGA